MVTRGWGFRCTHTNKNQKRCLIIIIIIIGWSSTTQRRLAFDEKGIVRRQTRSIDASDTIDWFFSRRVYVAKIIVAVVATKQMDATSASSSLQRSIGRPQNPSIHDEYDLNDWTVARSRRRRNTAVAIRKRAYERGWNSCATLRRT